MQSNTRFGKRVGGAIACISVLLASACDAEVHNPPSTGSSRAGSHGAVPSKAIFDSKGNVLSLPNIVSIVGQAVPADVAGSSPWSEPFTKAGDKQFHVWEVYRPSLARSLTVEVTRAKNVKKAQEWIADERTNMANTDTKVRPRTVSGNARPVDEIDGECLSIPIEQYHVRPMRGDRSRTYRVSGVRLYCRVANVGVAIMWRGMDYATPGVFNNGKGLSYEKSKQQAIAVMKPIVASLTPAS